MEKSAAKADTADRAAGMVLAISILALTGCPHDSPKAQPDSRLINTWENGEAAALSGLYKKFTINRDFTFAAEINPAFIEAVAKAKAQAGGTITDDTAIQAVKLPLGPNPDDTIASWTWKVTGKLTIDGGNIYIMSKLEEKNGVNVDPVDPTKGKATTAVAGYNGEKVKITFNSDSSFTFTSAGGNEAVTAYFGGAYRRVP
ncbi:MAG: hypothetical protein LBF95_09955 [Treponema sp.]|jgi:hypothetical protein|nr:hypothetical protein [Treponema sp.]